MRKKDGLLLLGGLVLAAAGVGITAGLQGKGNGSRSSSEDALLSVSSEESREAQSVEERFGIPEAPGYEWIYKDDDSALLPDMSFSDIMELPVYYFTVPENFDLFCENLAKAVLGEDYTVAESVSAPAEEHFVFPEWGNAVYYTLPEEGTARITVSPYGGYYNGQYFYALRSRSEKTERLLEEAEAFLETCQLGFWKNGRSYMQLSETVAGVRAIPVFEGIPAGEL